MYTRKTYRFPGSIEVEEYHSGKYGAPGQARGKKRKPTPEEIKKRNQTNRENYVRRLMKANFRKNDYWITLTYQKGSRPSVEKMRKDVDKLLRKVRSAYRKKGQEFKYILRMGIGKRGGPHLHILVNRITDTDLIFSDQWEHGGIFFKPAYEEGGFKALADYIVKPLEQIDDGGFAGTGRPHDTERLSCRNGDFHFDWRVAYVADFHGVCARCEIGECIITVDVACHSGM